MTRRNSRYIIALLVIIGAGVFILLVGALSFHKQSTLVAQKQEEYRQKNEQLKTIEAALEEKPALERQLQEIETQLASLDKDLVDYKFIPTYLQQIQRAIQRTGNTLRTIQPDKPAPLDLAKSTVFTVSAQVAPAEENGPQYRVQRIGLDVSGSYASVVRLLDALRRFPKMIYVRSINVTPQAGQNVTARLETYAIITPDQYQDSSGKVPAKDAAVTTEAKP